jgi:hypothetical protein
MPDPDMVSRAHRAAATLERAWERWRIGHGLAAEPLPPVSSYVGYSIDEPWGHPRVVFGVDAYEAEVLAALLDSHDSAGFGAAREPAGRPGVTARPVANARPQGAARPAAAAQPATVSRPAGSAQAVAEPRPAVAAEAAAESRPEVAAEAAAESRPEVAAEAAAAVRPAAATQPVRPRPTETGLGYPYPALADGAIRVPVSYQGSGTGAAPAGAPSVPSQPGSGRPAWADEASLREADTLDSYPAAGLAPVDVSVLASDSTPAALAARTPAFPGPDERAAGDAAIVVDDSTDADFAPDSRTEGDGGEADNTARGHAAAEEAADTGPLTGVTGPGGAAAGTSASEPGSAGTPVTNLPGKAEAVDGSRPGHNGTPARVSTAPRAGAPVADAARPPAAVGQRPAVGPARPAVSADSLPRAAATERDPAPRSRPRPGRRPYTPKPIPPRPTDVPTDAGEALATPGAPPAALPHHGEGLVAAASAHGLLTAPWPADLDVPAPTPADLDVPAPTPADLDVPAPASVVPDEDDQPTGDVEPVDVATPNLGISGTIAAELAGWAAGELPGQASARLAAWATVGGVPASAYRDSRTSTAL